MIEKAILENEIVKIIQKTNYTVLQLCSYVIIVIINIA